MSELHEECGVVAIYHLPGSEPSPLTVSILGDSGPEEVSRLVPRMLLDLQNRGQLAAGMTTYSPFRKQLIDTHKEVGSVSEVFHFSRRDKFTALMDEYAGRAAIGHVRYATCGKDDRSYAQPFERHHIKKHKWFSFAFNGQLTNYDNLREMLLNDGNTHLARETDTEVFMHFICSALSPQEEPDLLSVCQSLAQTFDGSYSIVFLNALGQMFVARDPLGMKPLCYAVEGNLFAAASESVALFNLGFKAESIKPVLPGQVILVNEKGIRFEQFAESTRTAHCFFEWVYFANVASTINGKSVYLARKNSGIELARQERQRGDVPIDFNTIVVPVPDTSKAAADAMAYELGIPSLEGLIRNRYSGRTFIEGGEYRWKKAETKYTPLREVLEGKRVFLVEDSIVRSTTMRVLLQRIRNLGGAKEIHVRAACPPIIAPCFYGIDMSTYNELFVPQYMDGAPLDEWAVTPEVEKRMAADLGADTLRYLPVDAVPRAIGLPTNSLCQACITGTYPTVWGGKLAKEAFDEYQSDPDNLNGQSFSCKRFGRMGG
ncbi:MAG: amidophosphoribosyltransferase [Planctomycetaceae bacterium]|jgi:amidophosphoribosyltransferase|nr:amidophosphoribosyltransferase [Planctomycetaceae bacterium]